MQESVFLPCFILMKPSNLFTEVWYFFLVLGRQSFSIHFLAKAKNSTSVTMSLRIISFLILSTSMSTSARSRASILSLYSRMRSSHCAMMAGFLIWNDELRSERETYMDVGIILVLRSWVSLIWTRHVLSRRISFLIMQYFSVAISVFFLSFILYCISYHISHSSCPAYTLLYIRLSFFRIVAFPNGLQN